MKIDNEKQRKALLQIINKTSISGANAEYITDLKRKIAEAEIEENNNMTVTQ